MSPRGWSITPRGDYPPDWPAIAQRVKDAAGWRCIRCEHPHAPAIGYCLTVHHLNGDKGDSRWWNLLALCQRCHLSIQGRVDPSQAYLHPHTPWFKPYAAGYYVSTFLGVELPRADVERYLEVWLLVGQPWLGRTPEQHATLYYLLDELERQEQALHEQRAAVLAMATPRIRCLDCGAPYLEAPKGWACLSCGGMVSQRMPDRRSGPPERRSAADPDRLAGDRRRTPEGS